MIEVYFRCNNGGWNKTHGAVESTPRLDSFEAAGIHGWGCIFLGNTVIDAYQDEDCLVIIPPDTQETELKLSRKRNGYGGQQTFFICPKCKGRFRYLYLFNGGFRCRKCANLNYRSQQQTKDSMTDYFKGMEYVEKHLSPPPFPIDGFSFVRYLPDKPRGMHRTTYLRYLARFFKYQEKYTARLVADLARISKPFR